MSKKDALETLNVLKNIFPDVRDYFLIKEALEENKKFRQLSQEFINKRCRGTDDFW